MKKIGVEPCGGQQDVKQHFEKADFDPADCRVA